MQWVVPCEDALRRGIVGDASVLSVDEKMVVRGLFLIPPLPISLVIVATLYGLSFRGGCRTGKNVLTAALETVS